MEHCRGSLVREGGSLESYWCPAPQEFKSLPRRSVCFDHRNQGIEDPNRFLIFHILITVFMWLNHADYKEGKFRGILNVCCSAGRSH